MPARQGAPLGAPCWIDLSTSDVDRAKQFYGAVFGWSFEDAGPEYGGYVNASKDGPPVAGMIHNDPQWNTPDAWSIYLHTADVKATFDAAIAAGATSWVEPMEVKGKGFMAVLTDPTGAHFGLWQPTGHQGHIAGEAGAPVYFQLTTRDYGKALDFYREVFGWQTEVVADTDEFRYSTANFDGEAMIGVMDGTHDLADGRAVELVLLPWCRRRRQDCAASRRQRWQRHPRRRGHALRQAGRGRRSHRRRLQPVVAGLGRHLFAQTHVLWRESASKSRHFVDLGATPAKP